MAYAGRDRNRVEDLVKGNLPRPCIAGCWGTRLKGEIECNKDNRLDSFEKGLVKYPMDMPITALSTRYLRIGYKKNAGRLRLLESLGL